MARIDELLRQLAQEDQQLAADLRAEVQALNTHAGKVDAIYIDPPYNTSCEDS